MSKYIKALKVLLFCLIGFLLFIYTHQNILDRSAIKAHQEERQLSNIEAFAKLYGYVRYFHPSDEVEELDWNRFAIYGVNKVKEASSEKELKSILEYLILPIAPKMSIYFEDSQPQKVKSNKTSGKVVAWQHYGPAGDDDSLYKNRRISAILKDDKYSFDAEKLFAEFPKVNETIKSRISPELYCSIPLVLYQDKKGTIGSNKISRKNFKLLKENLMKMDPNLTSEDENVRFAGIIVTWNVLNHFYPYFKVINANWESQLDIALRDTSDDKNREEYINSLSKLMEKTKDGHASFSFDYYKKNNKRLPFILDIIENEVVISVIKKDSPFQPGDMVLSINGENSNELIKRMSSEIPGSSQFKIYKALGYIMDLDTAVLKIKRGDQVLEFNVDGNSLFLDEFSRKEPFKEVKNDIFYIDLTQDVQTIMEENIQALSEAKGIIFDLRGYPNSFSLMQEVVGHLTEKPIQGPIWRIMQTIYPDQKKVTFAEGRDGIQPKKPFINGKVIFLSYAGTMSQPEYFLGYIRDNQLAEIVGQPTAGSDGNIQTYTIPGNLKGVFTGMEILNADRSQTHIIGIQPNLNVQRTIEGVKSGEDEYIKKALELIDN